MKVQTIILNFKIQMFNDDHKGKYVCGICFILPLKLLISSGDLVGKK